MRAMRRSSGIMGARVSGLLAQGMSPSKVGKFASSVHALPRPTSANAMKAKRTPLAAQMRAEYDFDYAKATRGKYYKRLLKEGSNVVTLDRDVAKAFPDSGSVNNALRRVLKSRQARRRSTRFAKKTPRAG
jgi:hypothetical protein